MDVDRYALGLSGGVGVPPQPFGHTVPVRYTALNFRVKKEKPATCPPAAGVLAIYRIKIAFTYRRLPPPSRFLTLMTLHSVWSCRFIEALSNLSSVEKAKTEGNYDALNAGNIACLAEACPKCAKYLFFFTHV